jgi:hypothetical protein
MSDVSTTRSGRYGGPKLDPVAQRLVDQLEREPDTDWVCSGEFLVLRMYEEGKTYSYMVTKTLAEVRVK